MDARFPSHEKNRFSTTNDYEISDATRNAYLYGMDARQSRPQRKGGMLNPMNWKLWQRLLAAVIVIIITVAIIVGAVLGSRANAYPAYAPLNYSLKDTYSGSNFFDNFDYFQGYDPTQGFVHYNPLPAATEMNLTSIQNNQAVLKVDTSEESAPTGRHSVRITSKNQYNNGLFIFDVAHSPYGCGTWPSIWLVDPSNWPANGEIDVLESVNQGTSGNQMTLHTTDGCTMGVKRKETGTVLGTSCVNTTDDNAGCAVKGEPDTYGPQFNANGGGVYATEWRSDGIRTWFFPRNNIPSDIQAGTSPQPDNWGTALADFPKTDCDITSHFKNMSIVVDIDLCGTWAGSQGIYNTQDNCPGTCTNLVSNNASAFDNAYWSINNFKVFLAS